MAIDRVLESLKQLKETDDDPHDVMGTFIASRLRDLEPANCDWIIRVIGDLLFQLKQAERNDTVRDMKKMIETTLKDLTFRDL